MPPEKRPSIINKMGTFPKGTPFVVQKEASRRALMLMDEAKRRLREPNGLTNSPAATEARV